MPGTARDEICTTDNAVQSKRVLRIGRTTDGVLAKSISLEEASSPRFVRTTVWLVVAVLATFITLALSAQLDLVANGLFKTRIPKLSG